MVWNRHGRPSMLELGQNGRTSLYVHVPFCVVKCGYCDFNSYVLTDAASHDLYLEALAAELRLAQVPAQPSTVFIGGGTPTLLAAPRLRRLFEILRRHVDLDRCPEVTIEGNPESVDRERADVARSCGVNRASLGVQSFDAARLAVLERAHDARRAEEAYRQLRAAGFENLNMDLMFGLPGQLPGQWREDLDRALELRPDHLSCYNLTFEPGTRFHREREHGRMQPNDEALDAAMFLETRQVLQAAGYRPYEISNFAGRGGPCRHNDHYWLQGDYVGVGPGASSHRRGVRCTNLKPLDSWSSACLAGVPPAATAETLTPRQRAGEAIWLGLRRATGVDLAEVTARLGIPVGQAFAPLIEHQVRQGRVELAEGRLVLTEAGLLLADSVAGEYLASGD
jgi:oxygen-independent coproporphyrinogen-3 oxidase